MPRAEIECPVCSRCSSAYLVASSTQTPMQFAAQERARAEKVALDVGDYYADKLIAKASRTPVGKPATVRINIEDGRHYVDFEKRPTFSVVGRGAAAIGYCGERGALIASTEQSLRKKGQNVPLVSKYTLGDAYVPLSIPGAWR